MWLRELVAFVTALMSSPASYSIQPHQSIQLSVWGGGGGGVGGQVRAKVGLG